MSEADLCPECGLPVSRSLHGDTLAFSTLFHLGEIRRGCEQALFAVAGYVFTYLTSCFIWYVLTPPRSYPSTLLTDSLVLTAGIAATASIWGWLRMSRDDDSQVGTRRNKPARWILRTVVIADAVVWLLMFYLQGRGYPNGDPAWLPFARFMLPLAWWVATVSFCNGLASRARYLRLPRPAKSGLIATGLIVALAFAALSTLGTIIGLGAALTSWLLFGPALIGLITHARAVLATRRIVLAEIRRREVADAPAPTQPAASATEHPTAPRHETP